MHEGILKSLLEIGMYTSNTSTDNEVATHLDKPGDSTEPVNK
jgi:hypothetical protein